MNICFVRAAPAETGGGGGADYIEGLAAGLRGNGVAAEIRVGAAADIPREAVPVIDGMLLPALRHRLPEWADADPVALIHHIGAAAGRDAASRERTIALEREMLPRFRRVVATSAPVAERLRTEFGIDAFALPPGLRDNPPAVPDPADPVILSVGVLTRRKRHDELIRAAARLLDLPWRLIIAGDTQRDPAHPAELLALAADLGIADRLSLLTDPAPDTLERAWRSATVFALATRWEGYPSAIAEAVGRGIPVLTTTGAHAEAILPPTAGAICAEGDWATFGKCLRRIMFDHALRADFAEAAVTAGRALPRWSDRARQFVDFLDQP